MALSTKQLEKRCGIDPRKLKACSVRRPKRWLTAKLRFLGAERYVLSTKDVELSLETKRGGFGLTFREPVYLLADHMLGNKIRSGLLIDVIIEFPVNSAMPELSLAQLTRGVYPRVLRAGEQVKVD